MSKQIAIIPLGDITRAAIIQANGRSLAKVKEDVGCQYIINSYFYNFGGGPVGLLKVDGKVLSTEPWNTYGMTWDIGPDIRMDVIPDKGGANYLSGVELLTPGRGPGAALFYNSDIGGKRGRSAAMIAGDKLVLYCSGDGTADAATPETLRDELVAIGSQYARPEDLRAQLWDGGGSAQCDFDGARVTSSRVVHGYFCVWTKGPGQEPEDKEETTMSKKVVLDPGHGMETAGKRSPDGTYLEHEFALDMAKRLKPILERHGVEVTLTRTDEHDVSLADRVKTANAIKDLDLFVSLHSNAAGSGASWMSPRGYGVYTSAAGATAGRNIAANHLIARAKEAGIGLWGGGLHHDISLYVLKNTVAPAVLIEHLFHDNLEDVALLKDSAFRDKLAEVDAKGILDYLGISWVEDTAGKDDLPAASDYAKDAWAKACAEGFFDGTNPQGPLTREQAAVVLDRLGLL